MKWQWLPRALNSASKERKIGDVEPESGFAASDILSDLSLSLCVALRKSQLSGHPEKPRFWGNLFPFGEVLAVPSVIQKDALCSPKAEDLLSCCSVCNSSAIADKGHHADGYSVPLLGSLGKGPSEGLGVQQKESTGDAEDGLGRRAGVKSKQMRCNAQQISLVLVHICLQESTKLKRTRGTMQENLTMLMLLNICRREMNCFSPRVI